MDYLQKLNYHFKPKKGWINDPNGLVYYKGYYHVFYQHAPDFEVPWQQPMHWGHARTKDFLSWEELPVALYPDRPYDNNGCWSGTAIVKDDVLYLFYASVAEEEKTQTVSVAYSLDGIHFEKYVKNPVIDRYPADGGPIFVTLRCPFLVASTTALWQPATPKAKRAACFYTRAATFLTGGTSAL